jgi:uncharacterized protein (DUF1778 family)
VLCYAKIASKEFKMRVTVHVSEETHKAAKKAAKKEGVSVSAYYADAVARKQKELKRQEALKEVDKLIGHTYVAQDALEVLKEERRRSSRY